MKVILKKEVIKLGQRGATVNVSDGFARNYLIPNGLAVAANPSNASIFQHEQREQEQRHAKEAKAAHEIARKIKKLSCSIPKQVGENDKLFGSVTALDIIKALEAEGIKVEKHQIELEEPIRTLGIYPVLIKLHPEVEARLKVWVVKA